MQGLMMEFPLTVTSIMRHGQRVNGGQEIVSVTRENPRHRYTYREAFTRATQLAHGIDDWGVAPGTRIATMAWNDYRHFEIYYAVSCSGYVCHTLNPRLFPEQLIYIINDADDRYLFLDPDFVPLAEQIASHCPGIKSYVVMTDSAHMPETELPGALCYEEFIADRAERFDWPDLDEKDACSLCYTSGTTGNPKGVLYSHRSTVLHTYASLMPDALSLSAHDVVMPVVPMFHANAWGLPYAAPALGSKIVFPGGKMGDGATLVSLINEEDVTFSAGVPTVWLAMQAHLKESGKRVDSLREIVVGGAACPLSIAETFEHYGVETRAAWGMTELSPLGTSNNSNMFRDRYSEEEFARVRLKAGRPVYGVDMKIVDEQGRELPWDGEAYGALKVRGPWICSGYYNVEDSDAHDADGWFETGDVATIDPDGYMAITDRTKDVIKSGGEWISSAELEKIATDHPGVSEAAVIGRPHSKWGERPLLVVVRETSTEQLTENELLEWFEGRVAQWWIPDAVEFVGGIPHTATGKIAKVPLREQFADYRFNESVEPKNSA